MVKPDMKLVKICMEENCFTFRSEYPKQLKGAPMGNPSPLHGQPGNKISFNRSETKVLEICKRYLRCQEQLCRKNARLPQ